MSTGEGAPAERKGKQGLSGVCTRQYWSVIFKVTWFTF